MDKSKIKVFFVIPSLRAGGAERVMSFVSDNLNKDRFDASLVVIESDKDKAYELNNIETIFLNKRRSRNAIIKLFLLLVKKKPDIVLGSIGQINIMLSFYAIFLRNIKFIARETMVRGTDFNENKSTVLSLLGKIQKITIDKVICQSKDMRDSLIFNFGYRKDQLDIINNPIANNWISKDRTVDTGMYKLITVGRLEPQKGYHRILSGLAKLKTPYRYTIIGSGSLKDEILNQAKELDIEKNIIHVPYTKRINDHLLESDLYVQGSYCEGFPNALLESCATGTAVLAYDAPGGINEIIQNGINGYRVTTEEEFVNKLNLLLKNLPDPKVVRDSVSKRYSQDSILKKYEQLFNDIMIQ